MAEHDDIRMRAVEQAVKINPQEWEKIAEDILGFVSHKYPENTGPAVPTRSHLVPRGDLNGQPVPSGRKWNPAELTPVQKDILRAVIERWKAGKKINGTAIAKDMKMTQSNASNHMRALQKKKYIGRNGNTFWPVYMPNGKPMDIEVTQCPPAIAKGGQATLYPLGEVARMSP